MRFCGQCGSAVPDDAKACPQCGAMLDGASAPAPAAKNSFVAMLKEKKNLLIGIAAAIVVLILAIALLPNLFGSYKTPVKLAVSSMNAKKLDLEDTFVNSMGGFGKSELKTIYKILSSSDNFKDYKEDSEDRFADMLEDTEDDYGKNWKVSYKIDDKEKLDKDDLKDAKDSIKNTANSLIDWADEILDMDNGELKDTADEMGLKKDDLKKLAQTAKDLGKKLKKAKVSAGYELDLNMQIKGSEDDEDYDTDMIVVKVGGKWVALNAITSYSQLTGLCYALGY